MKSEKCLGGSKHVKERRRDLGSGAEMGREVVPGGIKRGQIMQGLIQTLSRVLVFIPRATGGI